jgi:hypothetical protein
MRSEAVDKTLTLSGYDVDQLRERVENYRAAESPARRASEAAILAGIVAAVLARLDEPAEPDRVSV